MQRKSFPFSVVNSRVCVSEDAGVDSSGDCGSWSVVDEARGCIRSKLTWIPAPGASQGTEGTDGREKHQSVATRILGGTLHSLLSADVSEKKKRFAETDARRFFPSSLAVLLTRPHGVAPPSPVSAIGGHQTVMSRSTGGVALSEWSRTRQQNTSGSSDGSGAQMFIVVENNFRVYAYTRDDLHLALLALFCKVRKGWGSLQ